MTLNFSVGPNQFAAFPFAGDLGPIHGTITLNDTAKAFLFVFPGGVDICPVMPGPFSVIATINALNAANVALEPVVITLNVMDTLPVLATAVVMGAPVAVNPGNTDFGVPTNSGNATVSF